jgi:hypothetical protein
MSWDPIDRDLAIAYREYEASICPRCGTNPADWLDEKGELVEPPPYLVTSVRCYGCVSLEEDRARVDKASMLTVSHRLVRIPRKVGERELAKWQMKRSRSD